MQNNENEVVYLYLDDIIPNRFQPRQIFDEKALKELAISIKEHGVIQPIIVRNIGNKYEIIAGERRYKASALAGLTKIPAIVRNLDDKESSKVALLENLQRKNLNPIEEARTYQKILELDQMTQEELAKTMGKSQSAVANKIRLLALTDEVQDALLKEQISERHARALLNITDAQQQKDMLKEIIAKKMTVRELEEAIKQMQQPQQQVTQPTEITPSDIEELLQPTPKSSVPTPTQPVENPTAPAANQPVNSTIGIDYSTPPKFIDFGESAPNMTENLTPSATKPVDLDQIKENSKDINPEKPSTNLDELLKISDTSDTTESAGNQEGTTGGGFKFFSPEPIEPENLLDQHQTAPQDLFSIGAPPSISTNETAGMDNSLQGISPQDQSTQPNIPIVDTYNNPFARNPIFADDVQKIENIHQNVQESTPKYTLNESIDLVRKAIQDIEASGFKVDTEEMNFDKNYQIVIKIAKE